MSEGRLYFNKLVRDIVPDSLGAKGCAYETRILDNQEFEQELLKKVGEESNEVASAKDRTELIKEIADLEDVLDELKRLKSIAPRELEEAKETAFSKKGGFTKHLFLVWSADDGYKKE